MSKLSYEEKIEIYNKYILAQIQYAIYNSI